MHPVSSRPSALVSRARHVSLVLAALPLLLGAAACADDEPGTTPAGSVPSFSAGPPPGGGSALFVEGVRYCAAPSTCSQATLEGYVRGALDACDAPFRGAYGEGYRAGSFAASPCEPWLTCAYACDCADEACLAACTQPSAACTERLQPLYACLVDHGQDGGVRCP